EYHLFIGIFLLVVLCTLSHLIVCWNIVVVALGLHCPQRGRLLCTARPQKGVHYRRVSWYRVLGENQLSGLVLKDLLSNWTRPYIHVNRSYEIDADSSLVVPLPRAEDEGLYRCVLWAPVGEQIQTGDALVSVHGCTLHQSPAVDIQRRAALKLPDSADAVSWLLLLGLLIAITLAVRRKCRKTKSKNARHSATELPPLDAE
uniref:Ig-like domain-containing protein n=1 Tax=Lepisosteus oculatus TaxID=7918 RepID=W5M2D5_LEPOC